MASHRALSDIVSSPMKSRTCPECQIPLRVKLHHGVELDLCTGCRGVWFDATELSAVLLGPAKRPTAYTIRFDESHLRPLISSNVTCPVCATASLGRAVWGDVVAFKCEACQGIWISAHSIERLRAQLVDLHSSKAVGLNPGLGKSGWEVAAAVLEVLSELVV